MTTMTAYMNIASCIGRSIRIAPDAAIVKSMPLKNLFRCLSNKRKVMTMDELDQKIDYFMQTYAAGLGNAKKIPTVLAFVNTAGIDISRRKFRKIFSRLAKVKGYGSSRKGLHVCVTDEEFAREIKKLDKASASIAIRKNCLISLQKKRQAEPARQQESSMQ